MHDLTTLTEEEAYELVGWSADVDDLPTLLGHLDRMPKLRKIKIDRLFVENNGFDVFEVLAERDTPLEVFYDAKYVEIPPKLAGLAKSACKRPIWMVNCMAGSVSSGEFELTGELTEDDIDGLKRFADVCLTAGVRPCAVSVLTTTTDKVVNDQYGRGRIDQVLYYAEILLGAGFTDMVCSPKELRALRSDTRFDKLNAVNPAIRPKGSLKDDQVNAATPRDTLEAGSNLLIIGRPITNGDPAENLDNIVTEILMPAA